MLGDFGIAQPTATFEGIAGTRTYKAPEIAQTHGIKKTNPSEYNRLVESTGLMTTATDIYTFGIVMHMLATLKTHKVAADPYDDGHMEGKARVGVKLPSLYWTQGLKTAIQRCLSVEPEGRPEMTTDPVNGFLQVVMEVKIAEGRLLVHSPTILRKTWARPADKEL